MLPSLLVFVYSVLIPPILCCSLAPSPKDLPIRAVAPAPAIPTAIVTPFARLLSVLPILPSTALAPSFTATIAFTDILPMDFKLLLIPWRILLAPSFTAIKGLATTLPTDFSTPPTLPRGALALSLKVTKGLATVFPTDFREFLTFVIPLVAPSLIEIKGLATSFPTVRTPTLILFSPDVALSWIPTATEVTLSRSPPKVFLILAKPCEARSLIFTIGVKVVAISLSLCLIFPTVLTVRSFSLITGENTFLVRSLILWVILSTFSVA